MSGRRSSNASRPPRGQMVLAPSATRLPPAPAEDGALPVALLAKYRDEMQRDPLSRAMSTILSRTEMSIVLTDRMTEIVDQQVFNVQVSEEGTPVANQLRSGRCWLFAFTNVVRTFVIKKYNLKEFQLSQSFLSFYDHLSKVNWLLETMIDIADVPLDDRTVQSILTTGIQDGGQAQMAINLVETFGLCPQTVYPESWNSSHSKAMDAFMSSKCREYTLELRKAYETARSRGRNHVEAVTQARKVKEAQVKEVYRVLCTLSGTPPQPDEPFLWEFRDQHGKFRKYAMTPREFARECGYDYAATVSLVNDPRHAYGKIFTVAHLGNVVGGKAIRYCNVSSDELKQAAIRALKADFPVWFGCDVNKVSNTQEGLMDLNLYHYDDAFGTKVNTTKKERLQTGDSSMTHAMMLTGVHLDKDGPVRWRVENSWGPDRCNKGFLVMSDDWFTEYVFQVLVPMQFVDRDLVDLYDHSTPSPLPVYDPLGALA